MTDGGGILGSGWGAAMGKGYTYGEGIPVTATELKLYQQQMREAFQITNQQIDAAQRIRNQPMYLYQASIASRLRDLKPIRFYRANTPVRCDEGEEIPGFEPLDELRMKVARWLKNPPKTH